MATERGPLKSGSFLTYKRKAFNRRTQISNTFSCLATRQKWNKHRNHKSGPDVILKPPTFRYVVIKARPNSAVVPESLLNASTL